MIGAVDSHIHLFAPDRFEYDWMSGAYAPLRREASARGLEEVAATAEVRRAVAVEATATAAETEWLLDLAAAEPAIAGVVGWLDLRAANVSDLVDALCARADTLLVGFPIRRRAKQIPSGYSVRTSRAACAR